MARARVVAKVPHQVAPGAHNDLSDRCHGHTLGGSNSPRRTKCRLHKNAPLARRQRLEGAHHFGRQFDSRVCANVDPWRWRKCDRTGLNFATPCILAVTS